MYNHGPLVDRIPPHNLEAEMALLGAILVDPDLFEVAGEHVRPADFYAHVHETIFQAIADLRAARRPIDKISLAEQLRLRNDLENVGGLAYLSSLMDTVQTATSAEYYAKIIAEKAGLRRIIHVGVETTARGYEEEEVGPLAVANAMIGKLEAAVAASVPGRPLLGPGIAAEVHAHWTSDRRPRRLTPWAPMNRGMKGFGNQLSIWAGYPKQGKSTAVINLAEFDARHYGKDGVVALWPLEMGRVETTYKLLSMYTGIPSVRIQERDLDDHEFALVRGAMRMVDQLPLAMFDQRPMLDMGALRMHLRKLKRDRGLVSAYVDHVGWLREVRDAAAKNGASGVHSAQERIFIEAAELAGELEISLHLVMHLKRPKDMAGDDNYPKPSMFDLRGGGNPEGHAHNVILVWRPDPKNQPNVGAFIVELARGGGEGTNFLEYKGEQSVWLDGYDTSGDGGRWFPMAEPIQGAAIALPYSAAPSEEEEEAEFYGTDDFPQDRPDFLDEEEAGGFDDPDPFAQP